LNFFATQAMMNKKGITYMCTSFSLTAHGQTFFARTMDFAFLLDGEPIVMPQGYQWSLQLGGQVTNHYGFVGMGKQLEEFLFIDGVNEKGLAIAELYFSNEAIYCEYTGEKMNLAPHELVHWVLGNVADIPDLYQKISRINLVQIETALLGITVPLHFIVTDTTGRCVVIETNRGIIEIKENPIGVMTNSPELEWHIKNIGNYLAARPANFPPSIINGVEVPPFGLGNGTSILPGGSTSPERFIRTVYNKQFVHVGKTVEETVNAMFHLLNNVTIPKGLMVEKDGGSEYTQYRVVYNVTKKICYFNPYETQEVFSLELKEEWLQSKQPRIFAVAKSFSAKTMNNQSTVDAKIDK
jgi:penicillin V acylase-like amidase (Ntn superfamily)